MPISSKYKCLFIHIPKTGGTSIESALGILGDWRIENIGDLFGLIQSKDIKERGFKSNFLQHLTYEQGQIITPVTNNYRSFSIVRNPWDKMVSIYSNPDNNLLKVAAEQGIYIKDLQFKDFVKMTGFINHIHLESQYKFICDQEDKILVDFVGKFEYLQRDFKNLCEQLRIDLKLPHKNQSKRQSYRQYYSKSTKDIIYRRYQKDIELFDYRY